MVWVVGDQTIKGNETGTSFRQALLFKEIGFNLFDTMIYSKPNPGMLGAGKGYNQSFEYMFIFGKNNYPKTINIIKDYKRKYQLKDKVSTIRNKDGTTVRRINKGVSPEYGARTNVWYYDIGFNHTTTDPVWEHPAMFPEKLANDHIISWSNEGDLVYDPFIGSGTTAKMAMVNKRDYIGSEISKEYTDLANSRLDKTTKPLL